MHTFSHSKTLLHTFSLLVFKIIEILQCILKGDHYSKYYLNVSIDDCTNYNNIIAYILLI